MDSYSVNEGSFTEIACNDDFNPGTNDLSWAQVFGLTPGQTYYIMVDGGANSTGAFSICIENLPANPPPLSGQDCLTSVTICDEQTAINVPSVSDGFGSQEVTTGNSCWGSGGERQSVWYNFTIDQAGVLEFKIDPVTGNDDFDWSLYELPNNNCATDLTAANNVACNWSGCAGGTGATTDNSTSTCNGLCNGCPQLETPIAVTSGTSYVLLVDNFDQSNDGFNLNFANSTATFDSTIGTCGLLPADLLSFEASVMNDFVSLDWLVEGEENLANYVIERRGNNRWEEIGTVTAQDKKSYHMVDFHPVHGINIYHIKMVDFDGQVSFSDPAVVSFEHNGLSVFPIPASDLVTIEHTVTGAGPYHLQVFDLVGAEVWSKSGRSDAEGSRRLSLDVGAWNPGVYFIKLTEGGQQRLTKMIVE